jgi:hypothetical protein
MLLMQQDLWKYITNTKSGPGTSSNDRSLKQEDFSYGVAVPTLTRVDKIKEHITAGQLINSILTDSVMLNVIHLHDPRQIWERLNGKYNIQSSSRRLALKEKLYSLRLGEDKSIDTHLQEINLLVHQLAGLGVTIEDEDLVDLTLTSLPRS